MTNEQIAHELTMLSFQTDPYDFETSIDRTEALKEYAKEYLNAYQIILSELNNN